MSLDHYLLQIIKNFLQWRKNLTGEECNSVSKAEYTYLWLKISSKSLRLYRKKKYEQECKETLQS